MIGDLRPYAEYKDSGLPWLGQVPAHWEIKRLGSVFAERGETNELREVTEILSVLKDRGVIPYSEKGRIGNKASDDIGRYKIVRPDDLVVNCMNVIIGSLGRSRFTGCLSPVYYVLRRRDEKHDPSYLELVFQNKQFHESLIRIGNGILAHRMRIPMEKLKSELIPLPPPTEQAAIVRFLDWANGRLERTIRAKRKVIALLDEQKQAIIHRAVTRGLDPSVLLKESGVPWLGEIPAHWEQRALWSISNLRIERNPGSLELLSVFLDRGVIRYAEGGGQVHAPSLDLSNYQVVRRGDFVLNNQQAWRGSVGVSMHEGIVSPAYIVLSLSNRLQPQFANYLMRSRAMVDQFVAASKGVGDIQRQVFWPFLRMVQVPLPSTTEQQSIVRHLEQETAGLMRTISRLEREITLLREYRTRLVADVVTGKLDVREAASQLPDEELLPDLAAGADEPDDLAIEEEDDG